MTKTFSAKVDAHALKMLEQFCKEYHVKKSHVLTEILEEGLRKRIEVLELARSIQKGLEDEHAGEFFTADEVEQAVFHSKKKTG